MKSCSFHCFLFSGSMSLSPWTLLHYQKWSPGVSFTVLWNIKLLLKFLRWLCSGQHQMYHPACCPCEHQYISFLFSLVYFVLQWSCKLYTHVLEGVTDLCAKFWQCGCCWCSTWLGSKNVHCCISLWVHEDAASTPLTMLPLCWIHPICIWFPVHVAGNFDEFAIFTIIAKFTTFKGTPLTFSFVFASQFSTPKQNNLSDG